MTIYPDGEKYIGTIKNGGWTGRLVKTKLNG